MLLSLILGVLVVTLSLASPTQHSKNPRPLAIWHGMGIFMILRVLFNGVLNAFTFTSPIGDSHSSPGMLEFSNMIRQVHPGIFIHSVYIEKELDKDKQATYVCEPVYTFLSQLIWNEVVW